MYLNKIIIKSDFAHFKVPYSSKIQKTFLSPQPSTIIGILKTVYNENIADFIFGYTIEASEEIFRDLQKIYKEVNINAGKNEKDKYKNNKWITDPCEIEYLNDVTLTIYADLKEDVSLKEVLVLGKTDCLAKIISIDKVDIKDYKNIAFNQYSELGDGDGIISAVTIETKYNEDKGIFDIFTMPMRYNKTIITNYYDEEADTNLYLYKYKGVGDICAL